MRIYRMSNLIRNCKILYWLIDWFIYLFIYLKCIGDFVRRKALGRLMINCFIRTNQCIHRILIRLIRKRWGCKGIQQTLAIKIIKLMAIRIKKMRTSKLLHKQPTTAIQILLHLILPFEICQKIRKKNKRKRLKSN